MQRGYALKDIQVSVAAMTMWTVKVAVLFCFLNIKKERRLSGVPRTMHRRETQPRTWSTPGVGRGGGAVVLVEDISGVVENGNA